MTIVVAWVRTTKNGAEELVMVSDSRLNGGGYLDCAPKIFQFPRTDVIIGFSGLTLLAYPLLLQFLQSVGTHGPMMDRAVDYVKFRTYIIKILNQMFCSFDTYIDEYKKPDTAFLMGGYSWFRKEFCIEKIFFNKTHRVFEYRPTTVGIGDFGKVAFIGDWAGRGMRELREILVSRFGREGFVRDGRGSARFHMEPFEAVRNLLRKCGTNETIGGPPQLVKVSQFMNSRHLAVYWPNRVGGKIYVGGRPVFDFEKLDNWILDPDTLEKEHRFLM